MNTGNNRGIQICTMFKNMSISSKAAIFYVFASVLTKGLNIFTVPIFTRIMSTAEIGVVYNFNSWLALASVVISLALTSGGINIAFIEFEKERDRYQSSILGLIMCSAAVFAVLFYFNSENICNFFELDSILITVILLACVFETAKEIWMARCRIEYKYKSVFAVTVIATISSVIVSVIAVLAARGKNAANLGTVRILATYGILFAFDFFIVFLLLKRGKCLYHKKYWGYSLKLSLPLIVHNLSKSVLDVSDRMMITKFVNEGATGIYSTLYNLATLPIIVWNAINSSFVPFLFQKLKQKDDRVYSDVNRAIKPLVILFGVVSVGVTIIAPEIIRLLTTPEYYGAVHIIPSIAAGTFLVCLYNLFSDVLVFYKKTQYIMISTMTSAIVNVVLNYLLIPVFGFVAAAYTTLFAYIVLSVLQCLFMQKVAEVKIYDLRFMFVVTAIVILLCLGCNLLYDYFVIRYLLVLSLLILIVIFRDKVIAVIRAVRRK